MREFVMRNFVLDLHDMKVSVDDNSSKFWFALESSLQLLHLLFHMHHGVVDTVTKTKEVII